MQPENNWGDSSRDLAERQANYLILSTLEQKLPPELFRQILTQVQSKMSLPSRLTWSGQNSESTFADLKVAEAQLNEGFLTSLLHAVGDLKRRGNQKGQKVPKTSSLHTLLKSTCERQQLVKKNLLAKVRMRPSQLTPMLRREVELSAYTSFKRMKTVFCHADHSTDEVSSIFNVQFDRTGRFIISGADDGIIKVWDRNTLRLQASLHGHFDFITDIDISKCNRFIASAGKDAQVIIWDLKLGKIVKRLTSHQSLINRLMFVAPRVTTAFSAVNADHMTQQVAATAVATAAGGASVDANLDEEEHGPTCSYVKEQFLLTCSDDGTVHLYDFSPFSRVMQDGGTGPSAGLHTPASQQRSEYEELRTRRAGRRSAAEQNMPATAERAAAEGDDVYIFDLTLTPDDYRPGTRNKKLDVVVCSSAGIVVAGTSTGELFCWKLNFAEIARKNRAESYKYLGQFKVCKMAGVQFAEFSPMSDLLMTGSTDGLVKIWHLDIPAGKASQQQALKAFSMGDESRLVVTIDEKNGCMKTNSISYFDEEGAERFEYQPVLQSVSGQIGFSKAAGKDALKFSKSQCDAIKWSVRGRFAIASITSQIDHGDGNVQHPGDEQFKDEVCRIKLWDTVNETFYDDLARPSGFQLKKNSWVLAPHPIFEELLMTGCDGGTLLLWNLDTKQILQSFSQYGVYSIDGYQRDNPLDGKFSCDGKAFIVGNQLGTISLFSCEGVEHQYEATRVQQFFMYDRARNSQNLFEKIENRPQICGYNMIPHDALPSRPLIGKFKSDEVEAAATVILPLVAPSTTAVVLARTAALANKKDNDDKVEESKKELSKAELLETRKAKSRAFERRLMTSKGLGIQDEKYYQDQLQLCLQESFQPNVLEHGNHQLDALAESSIEDLNGGRIESGYIEEQSLVNALSPPRRPVPRVVNDLSTPASQGMRPRRAYGAPTDVALQPRASAGHVGSGTHQQRRRLRRRSHGTSLRNLPQMNDYDSDQLIMDDVGFAQPSPQSSYSHASDEPDDESASSDSSDLEIEIGAVRRQRFTVRRENMHEQNMRGLNQQHSEHRSRRRRDQRMSRRHRPVSSFDMQHGRRDNAAVDNSAASGAMDLHDSMVSPPPQRRPRGRPSNAERERRRQEDQQRGPQPTQPHRGANGSSRRRVIIEDEAMEISETGEAASHSRPNRNRQRQAPSRQGAGSGYNNSSSPEQAARGSTRRNARRIVDSSSSRMDDNEERKGGVSPSKQTEKSHNQLIRESGCFLSDREDVDQFVLDRQLNDSDHSNEKGRKSMSQPEPPGTQPDEDYLLVENADDLISVASSLQICSFCQKKDQPLVGPFCKYEDAAKTKMVGQPLWFHQDCVEFNQFSRFCVERKRWVNIGKALQLLIHKEQFTCFRCQSKGATVQCRDCSKAFHGYKCARMYTLQLEDAEGAVFYQCVFCRNMQNWEDRVSEITDKEVEKLAQEKDKEGYVHDKQYLANLKNIDKEHLLSSQGYVQQMSDSSTICRTYNPQVNDFVFYFFQGHEYYMSQYSLHFFCGQLEKFPRNRFMPWFKHPKIKKREFVRCRVEQVEVLFPSQRSINLISLYGDNCTQVTQTAEIIQRCTLVVVESQNAGNGATMREPIKFQVDIFPNSLPDFLIPQAVFTERYERYVSALQSGIAGKTFKVFLKEQNTTRMMRIVEGSSPLEPTLFSNSLWQNIRCVEANPGRSGRVTDMPQHRSARSRQQNQLVSNQAGTAIIEQDCERVSFWDVQFGGSDEIQMIAKNMHVFGNDEKAKLVNTLKDFYVKKQEYLECFMARVPLEIAADYRNIIPSEMFCNLIMDRLNNCYYRSQEQLLSDIDLISYNAKIYNGENHDIALNAKELCELIRVKLKQSMFTKSDTLMQQQMAVIGKLTVPAKQRSVLQQKSVIDELRHNLHTPEVGVINEPEMSHVAQPQVQQIQAPLQPETLVMIDTSRVNGVAEGTLTRLTRNTIGSTVTPENGEQLKDMEEEKQLFVEPLPMEQDENGAAMEKAQAATEKTLSKKSSTMQQRSGSQARQSNNMSRRRNRANANLPDSVDLEEKTQAQLENEDENQESSAAKRVVVTRNLRKRQRQE